MDNAGKTDAEQVANAGLNLSERSSGNGSPEFHVSGETHAVRHSPKPNELYLPPDIANDIIATHSRAVRYAFNLPVRGNDYAYWYCKVV